MAVEDYTAYGDNALWQLVRNDSHPAFDEIYRRYWSKMYRSANKVLNNHEVSSDIIQEVFANLWIKRETTVISSLSSYLYAMVRNQVFKHLRDGNISRQHLDRINRISDVNHTEQMVNFHQLQEIYHQSIATLPERCKEVFQLSRDENLSVKEIATRLDISPKTVENQMTKALKLLRVALKEMVLLLIFLLY